MATPRDPVLGHFLAPFQAVKDEAYELLMDARRCHDRMEMTEPDLAELLRMIQECRRFLAIPMPEERLPF